MKYFPRIKKRKSISTILFEIDNYPIINTVRVICNYNKNIESVYITFFLIYNHHKIYTNKLLSKKHKEYVKNIKFSDVNIDKIKENMIRNEMKKNPRVSKKELHILTGISIYKINNMYMKVRREQYTKTLNNR